eukprot:gene2163-2662_t
MFKKFDQPNIFMLNRFLAFYSNVDPNMNPEVISIFLDNNIEFNAKSYQILLEYSLQHKPILETEVLVKKMLRSNIFLAGNLLKLLVEFYIQIGNLERAIQFFEKIPRDALSQGSILGYNNNLLAILLGLIKNGKSSESLAYFQRALQKNTDFLDSIHFLAFLKALRDNNHNDHCINIISFMESKGYENTQRLTYLISFFCNEGETNIAKTLLDKIIANHIPHQDSFLPLFKKFIHMEDIQECTSLYKTSSKHKIVFDTPLLYHLSDLYLRHSSNQLYWVLAALKNTDISMLIVYSEMRENHEMHQILMSHIRKIENPRIHRITSNIIEIYLLMDEFQKALQWYSTRIATFNLTPNFNVVYNFILYHKTRGEAELLKYWEQKMADYSIIENPRERYYIELFFKENYKKNHLKPIDIFFDDIKLQQLDKMLGLTVTQTPLILKKTVSKSNEEILIRSYLHSKDITNLKNILIRFFRVGYVPPTNLLESILETIYFYDPFGFSKFVFSIPRQDRPLSFIPTACSIAIQYDIETGISMINRKDIVLFANNPTLWTSIVCGLLRNNLIDHSLQILKILLENKKPVAPEALEHVGNSILQNRYLAPKSTLLFIYESMLGQRNKENDHCYIPIFNCIMNSLIEEKDFEKAFNMIKKEKKIDRNTVVLALTIFRNYLNQQKEKNQVNEKEKEKNGIYIDPNHPFKKFLKANESNLNLTQEESNTLITTFANVRSLPTEFLTQFLYKEPSQKELEINKNLQKIRQPVSQSTIDFIYSIL